MSSVTIYEIAKAAGVSSSTVARILRGEVKESHRRSAEKAQRIRRLASEMGYRANLRARSFSRGRTHGIGLLYTDNAWIFEGVNPEVVNSLVKALQEKGYHLVFAPIDESGAWEEIVLGGQIDGGVVFQALPQDVSKAVRERQLPLVLLGDNSDSTLSQVVVNDFSGAYQAARHLIGLGHRRILLFVHESVKPHCSVQERRTGYRAALAEAGLEPIEAYLASEEDAMEMLLRPNTGATGVICYCDLEATLVVRALWERGISVPADVSIIGFNDVFATRHMTPPLTTVGFDAARIGQVGAELVLKEISSSTTKRQTKVVTIQPELIVRGSTGPARLDLVATEM